MDTKRRSMKQDEKAVSPVIGVIMMIAIVVVIAAVVAAFAYGIIGSVKKAPSTALVVEGAQANPLKVQTVTIFHHGGDTITGAFSNNDATDNISDKMNYIQVRLNGAPITNSEVPNAWLNDDATDGNWTTAFAPGDQLTLEFAVGMLKEGDSLVLLHTPSENIMQRITIT